jgi:hypothetical protein
MSNVWQYRDTAWSDDKELVGYDVEATDGKVGTIDECSTEADTAFVVVDTGSWLSDKKRMIPAGLVTQVDHDAQTVTVTVSKSQIKAAPDYEEFAEDSRKEYADYYGPFSW